MTLTRADLSPRERELAESCFHEGGHAVAAVALAGTLRSAIVSGGLRRGEITGLTTLDVLPPSREPEVAYSGVWAQACWRHGRRPSQAEVYGVLDGTSRKDRAMLSAAGGIVAGAGITPLLMRCWPAICAVAAKLWRDSEIGHADVCAALGLTDGGGPGSLELAMIRNGSAPGTFTVTRNAV